MKAHEFDQRCDGCEDMADHVGWSKAHRPNTETRRVNVDFPECVIASLNQQAQYLGVTRCLWLNATWPNCIF